MRFYGVTENQREIDIDMREMVDKVKKGEPLYGKTELTEYMQGVAARNSRYTGTFLHVIPWFNFANHSQVSRWKLCVFYASRCRGWSLTNTDSTA